MVDFAFAVRTQAPGALPNGTRIRKVNSEEGDTHRDGAMGTVIGSVGPTDYEGRKNTYAYFIEWDDYPGLPVGIGSWRIEKVPVH